MIRDKIETINHFNSAFGSLNASQSHLRIISDRLYPTSYRQMRASRQQIAELIYKISAEIVENIGEVCSFEGAIALEKFYVHYDFFLQKVIHPSIKERFFNTISCVGICKKGSKEKQKQQALLEKKALDALKGAYHASFNHPWLDQSIIAELTKNSIVASSKVGASVIAALRSSIAKLNKESPDQWVNIIHNEIDDHLGEEEDKAYYKNHITAAFTEKNEKLAHLINMRCLSNCSVVISNKLDTDSRARVQFMPRTRSSSLKAGSYR